METPRGSGAETSSGNNRNILTVSTLTYPRMGEKDAANSVRLWRYALDEIIPGRKQCLQLYRPANVTLDHVGTRTTVVVFSPSASATLLVNIAIVDPVTTQILKANCASRGISLDSVLLASLFLAAAEANKADSVGRIKPSWIHFQRSFVLGVICVVMALLAGSVNSKVLRYFCAFYGIITGVWAVNIAIVEPPGQTILVATTAIVKAAESAAGVKFTPVRMTVNCWDKLWNMAERHAREKGNVAVSMSSFARWKMRACNLKGWQWRHRAGESGRRPAFQLFGCIRLEGSADGSKSAPRPAEALGLSRPSLLGAHGDGETLGVEATPDAAALLLIVLDARYTLVYSESTPHGSGDRQEAEAVRSAEGQRNAVELDNPHGVTGNGDAGVGEGPMNMNAASVAAGGLELALVEGKGASTEQGAKWLLESARKILVDTCRERAGPGQNSRSNETIVS